MEEILAALETSKEQPSWKFKHCFKVDWILYRTTAKSRVSPVDFDPYISTHYDKQDWFRKWEI